jgi:HEAT repeat protein
MTLPFDERDRQSVLRDLESPDEEVRRLAVERVEALPRADVVRRLVDCLGDESWRVRKAAVSRLVAWPDAEETAGLLIEALSDGDDPGRRNAAVEALVQKGRTVVPHLIAAAECADVDVRKFAVDALAGIGDVAATSTLVGRLEDPDTNVRAAAADALGALGGEDVCSRLLSAATDGSQASLVRFSALHALDALDAAIPAAQLQSVLADPMLRPAGLALLGRVEDDAESVEILAKGLASGSRSCREASIRSLLRVVASRDGAKLDDVLERLRAATSAAPQIIDNCVERLPDADLSTQLALVQFLGLVGARRAAVPILRAGQDEALEQVARAALVTMGAVAEEAIDDAWAELSVRARRDACAFYGRMQGARSEARLLASLDDRDPGVRASAARSAGERKCADGVPQLVRRLEASASDEDLDAEDERQAFIEALVAIAAGGADVQTDRILQALRAMLSGGEAGRLAAAKVIGSIARPVDGETVTLLLRDASAAVRRAAVDALARLDPETASDALRLALADESPRVRVAAAAALGASESVAVFSDLAVLAGDEDPHVRAAAVRSLARRVAEGCGEDQRRDALDQLAVATEDVGPVALAAVESAREIGSVAVARMLPLLGRPEADVVRETVRCVGRHGDARELESVVPLVAHADWSVRAEAIQTLADRGLRKAVPAILRRLDTEQDEFVRSVTLRALQRLEI